MTVCFFKLIKLIRGGGCMEERWKGRVREDCDFVMGGGEEER